MAEQQRALSNSRTRLADVKVDRQVGQFSTIGRHVDRAHLLLLPVGREHHVSLYL